jgi:SNF2 family DNA or RNA helicase
VIVSGAALMANRRAPLFFASLLGGQRIEDAWRVPRRQRALDDIVIQVHTWLVRQGYQPALEGFADETMRREAAQRLSFERTRDAARALRTGASLIEPDAVERALAVVGWDRGERQLRPHQMNAVIHGLTAANSANFSVPGAGKTASTLALAAVHLANDTIDTLLVIGPLSCFRPWEKETAAAIPRLTTRRIRGSASERRRRIRELRPGDVALISYASAAADGLALIELCRSQRVMLIADESHRIKRFNGGTWAPAVVDIAKHAKVRAVLSGTPMPQSGRDLYTQLNVMWPARELTGPKDRFRARVANDFDGVLADVLPFVSRTAKSELGLPDPTILRHEVALPDQEAEIYRLVVDHLRAAVRAAGPSEADRLAALRRGRPLRLLQAATNPALLRAGQPGSALASRSTPTLLARIDAFDAFVTPPAKIAAAMDLVAAQGDDRKAVIWSTFIGNLDLVADLLRRKGVAVFQVDGRVQAGDDDGDATARDEPETREQVIAGFLDHPGQAVLVTNPASCSESISLHTACHTAIYLDRTYDCAQWLQSIDRIHRLGLQPDADVRIHILQATADGQPTADTLVDASLLAKEGVMRQLLEGAALQPFETSDDPSDAEQGDEQDLRQLLTYLLGEAG